MPLGGVYNPQLRSLHKEYTICKFHFLPGPIELRFFKKISGQIQDKEKYHTLNTS